MVLKYYYLHFQATLERDLFSGSSIVTKVIIGFLRNFGQYAYM